ncbi:acyltransferase [Pigmentiphaga sp. GD03639]|uniref:acyltransferase n=1 Tax=Pigmentiphaga sp. GD03639 TaxID=2975354 RepID=UPI0024489824|nr:acyltransferase [Pigmentiphaga sp. GD03639]MDH2239856.1 acyltransferase [Pigmentiphaga sp. GD03639]
MFFFDIIFSFTKRLRYWHSCDRIGPDVPLTHWKLYFPTLGRKLAQAKLKAFGSGSEIRPYAYLVNTNYISIGKNVTIRPNTMLMAASFAPIDIGDDVLIGSGVHLISSNHNFDKVGTLISEQGHDQDRAGISIASNVWIGANAIVLAGTKIGHHAVIAAASVVTKDVPPYSVVGGIPARILRNIEHSSAQLS